MSSAAYNRGTKLIRTQIDAAVAVRPRGGKPLNWDVQRNQLLADIATLNNELNRARRCVASQRAMLTVERETNAALREENETIRKDRAKWAKSFMRMRGRWLFVSRIVRAFVTPAQVAEFRAEEIQ